MKMHKLFGLALAAALLLAASPLLQAREVVKNAFGLDERERNLRGLAGP